MSTWHESFGLKIGKNGLVEDELGLICYVSERQGLVFAAFLSNFAKKKKGHDGKREKRTAMEWQLHQVECC